MQVKCGQILKEYLNVLHWLDLKLLGEVLATTKT